MKYFWAFVIHRRLHLEKVGCGLWEMYNCGMTGLALELIKEPSTPSYAQKETIVIAPSDCPERCLSTLRLIRSKKASPTRRRLSMRNPP